MTKKITMVPIVNKTISNAWLAFEVIILHEKYRGMGEKQVTNMMYDIHASVLLFESSSMLSFNVGGCFNRMTSRINMVHRIQFVE